MQWKEVPQDWIWDGDAHRLNSEIRAHMGRRKLTRQQVADMIGIKRQALARRLRDSDDRTPWRYSELAKLARQWDTTVATLNPDWDTNIFPENGTPTAPR